MPRTTQTELQRALKALNDFRRFYGTGTCETFLADKWQKLKEDVAHARARAAYM
jgi:hypothetical protein